jgi:hypothetical protein
MCPACIATTAWIVAGSTSAGGLTAFVAAKWFKGSRTRDQRPDPNPSPQNSAAERAEPSHL